MQALQRLALVRTVSTMPPRPAASDTVRNGVTATWVVLTTVLAFALWCTVPSCRRNEATERSARTDRPPAAATSDDTAGTDVPPSDTADHQAFPTRLPAVERIVAIGDIHGDLRAARTALRLAGVLDQRDQWSGGKTVLVQTGDLLDRGDDDCPLLELFARLQDQAKEAGGRVFQMNGNHELMNVLGDFRYVTAKAFTDFDDLTPKRSKDPALSRIPQHQRGRWAAFRPGGLYARRLAPHPVVLIVGDTLFAHGGVLPKHERYGLARINQETRAWLLGKGTRGRRWVARRDSPVWVRRYSLKPDRDNCQQLGRTLKDLKVARLVVGHTIMQQGIAPACEQRLWRIDTGMSAHYGGTVQVLEISGDEVRILKAE